MKIIEIGKNTCKGLRFRASKSLYTTDNYEIVEKRSLKLLKRQSCMGCEQCGEILPYLFEIIDEYDSIPLNKEFDTWKDYEVYVDIDEIVFKPIKGNRVYK